jgi:predicted nucleic-acid-binding protein
VIGLDSNIIVRYIAQDGAQQAVAANRLMEQLLSEREPGYVSLVVLVEVVWVMVSSYGADRKVVQRVVEGLLSAPQLRVQGAEQVWRAVQAYAQGKADFSDALISVLALDAGCRCTKTFDTVAARQPGFELLRERP